MKKKFYIGDIARLGISLVIISVIAFIMIFMRVSIKYYDNTLRASSLFFKATISSKNINEVKITDTWDFGKRTLGTDTFFTRSGKFTNEYGNYQLCASRYSKRFLCVFHSSGLLVLGFDSITEAENIYDKLLSQIEGKT